jgi:hypothetical protein
MTKVQGDQAPTKRQKMFKNWRTHPRRPSPNNPGTRRHASWGFWRAFFKPDSGFWMAFTFEGRSSVSCRWRNFRATTHQQNDRKCSKIGELIHEDRRRTIQELADTLGVCQGILTENLNMHRIAPSSGQRARPHFPQNHTVLTNSNIVIVLHPPYSPDLAPCDFALFPKLKWHWRDDFLKQCLTSKVVLNGIAENDFHGAFETWRNDGIAVYVHKETILKEMAAKISKLSQHFFLDLVRELSHRTS